MDHGPSLRETQNPVKGPILIQEVGCILETRPEEFRLRLGLIFEPGVECGFLGEIGDCLLDKGRIDSVEPVDEYAVGIGREELVDVLHLHPQEVPVGPEPVETSNLDFPVHNLIRR